MSRTELREEWEKRLAEFGSSGQTAGAWRVAQKIVSVKRGTPRIAASVAG